SDSNPGKLVMTDKEGKGQHSHAISTSVKITRNDKTVKLGDLKKGDSITVTTADDGSVKQVAATDSSSASRRAGSNGKSEKGDICECLMKLDLSSDQKAKVKEISAKYDEQWEATWREFSDRYQKATRLEAAMLAAIEENLSDSQRKHLRDQRR